MSADTHTMEVSYKAKGGKPSVFIVLLHGLDGDRLTFVNTQTGVSMQQLLSIDIPSATILTYIYPNSFTKFAKSKPSDSITTRAKAFLKLLSHYVSGNKSQKRKKINKYKDYVNDSNNSKNNIKNYKIDDLSQVFLETESFKDGLITPWREYIYTYLTHKRLDGTMLLNTSRDQFADDVARACDNKEIKSAAIKTYDIFISITTTSNEEQKMNPMCEQLYDLGFDRTLSMRVSEIYPYDLNRAMSLIQEEQKKQERKKENVETEINLDDVPIIFIGHSMGGLVMKSALQLASNTYLDDAQNHNNIFKRTMGCIFYASPHNGSAYADVAAILGPVIGNNVKNLQKDDEYLKHLRDQFNQIMKNHPVYQGYNILSFLETKKEYGKYIMPNIVGTLSGICGLEIETLRELPYCHTKICKPQGFNDKRYSELAVFIRKNLGIKVMGLRDNGHIGIPSHFYSMNEENQLKSFSRYYHPNYALDIISKIISNKQLEKIYKGLATGLSDVKVVQNQLNDFIYNGNLLDTHNIKKQEILSLIMEAKALCDKVNKSFHKMFKEKWDEIKELRAKTDRFDEYITTQSDYNMLQIVIALRAYCTNRENNSHALKLHSLKMIDEVRKKYKKICKKYKDLQKHKNQDEKAKEIAIGAGVVGAVGAVSVGIVAAPAVVAGAAAIVAGAAAAGIAGVAVHDKIKENELEFEQKCIKQVMTEENVQYWYGNLCRYLKELKDLDKKQRNKQRNKSYDSMRRVKANIEKRQLLLQSVFAK